MSVYVMQLVRQAFAAKQPDGAKGREAKLSLSTLMREPLGELALHDGRSQPGILLQEVLDNGFSDGRANHSLDPGGGVDQAHQRRSLRSR